LSGLWFIRQGAFSSRRLFSNGDLQKLPDDLPQPRPSEESILHFYQDYLPEDDSAIESWKAMMAPVFRRAAGLLERHGKRGKLLDVGAGLGSFSPK